MSQPASDDTAPLAKAKYVSDPFKMKRAAQKAAEKQAEVAAKAGKPEEAGGSGVKRRADSPPDADLAQAQAKAHALQTKLDYAEQQVRDLKTSLALGYEAHTTKERLEKENARLRAQVAEMRRLCKNAGVLVEGGV